MNRVKDFYETACLFLELPDMARYLLGTNFHHFDWGVFSKDEDAASEAIFRTAIKQGRWEEFKQLVTFRSGKNVQRHLH